MLKSTPNHSQYDQTIFDLAPFPMWIYDLETLYFQAVNKEAIRHYGYSKDEFLNMTIKEIRPKADILKLEKAVKEVRTRTHLYKESLFRHKQRNGSIIYVQIKSNLIKFRGKEAEIVTAIDLTDRYEKEKRIETQKNHLKAISSINQLLLTSSEWLQSVDTCFKIVGETIDIDRIHFFQNNLKEETTSLSFEWCKSNISPQINNTKLQNIPYSEFSLVLIPLKKRNHFEALVEELPSSDAKIIFQQQGIKSILMLPLWIKNIFFGFLAYQDSSEKIFSEDELQLLHALTSNLGHVIRQDQVHKELTFSEDRFKSIIEKGKDLIAILDRNGNYKYVAPSSKPVLGFPPDEFIGKNAFKYIHEFDIPRIKEKLTELLHSNYISIEPYRFCDANGNWRWFRTELSNHLNTSSIEGIVANTQEVTEAVKKKQSDELIASLILSIGQLGTLSSCLQCALQQLIKLHRIHVCEIWLVSEDASRLDLISSASQEKKFISFLQHSKKITSFSKGIGLPGHIWNKNSSELWKDLSNNKLFERSELIKSTNLQTGLGFPIAYNNKFIACITCYATYLLVS